MNAESGGKCREMGVVYSEMVIHNNIVDDDNIDCIIMIIDTFAVLRAHLKGQL
jgi:hypothetical protein